MAEAAYLLLGGNVGNRLAHLRGAVRGLTKLRGTEVLSLSRVYETAPIGPSDRPYLNACVKLRTGLSPMALLVECKRLEALAGRVPSGKWTARPLDVDILLFGRRRVRTPWLSVPHPLLPERPFALAPLSDLLPSYRAALKADPASVKIFPHAL